MSLTVRRTKQYDAIIVGSGAGGGMAVKILAEAGLNVALLEAGPDYDPASPEQRTQLKWAYESPRRGANTTRAFGDFDAAYGGWQIPGEPYTVTPGMSFDWFRSRMLGGRTNHWGRVSLRFGPLDFKRKSIDGLGDDWPIGYDEVKPFYDRVDKMIGVFGIPEGIYNEPDGFFLPPPKPRLHELMIKNAAESLGLPITASRLSVLTRPINTARGVCFYCNQCPRGCMAHADFSSSTVLVKPVRRFSNVTLITNAMVREVLTDSEGKATGVSYIDKESLMEYQLKAKTVVLAASACESARILLNSKSRIHANGLANSSDTVGRYLNDSTGTARIIHMPNLMDRKMYNEDGVGGAHIYIPWWLEKAKLDFARGYHIEFAGGFGMPLYGFGWGIQTLNGRYPDINGEKKEGGGYGFSLKGDYKRFYGSRVIIAGRGESVSQRENRCHINPHVVDKYGIPALNFEYKWTDQEHLQAKHMHDTYEKMIDALGGVPLDVEPTAETNYGLEAPGRVIHEVGTTRMGNDPKHSVVNKYGQTHEVKNLFVVDGGTFVSQPHKNPTWTILALSMRTSEYIVQEMKKQNL